MTTPATPDKQMRQDVAEAIAAALPDLDYDHDMGVWYWPNLGGGTWPLADAAIEAARPHIMAEAIEKVREAAHAGKAVISWNALPECDPDDFEFGGTVEDWLDDVFGGEMATREEAA